VRGPEWKELIVTSGEAQATFPVVAIRTRRGQSYKEAAWGFFDSHADFRDGVLTYSTDRSNFGMAELHFRSDERAMAETDSLVQEAERNLAETKAMERAKNKFRWDYDCDYSQMHEWPEIEILEDGQRKRISQEEFIAGRRGD